MLAQVHESWKAYRVSTQRNINEHDNAGPLPNFATQVPNRYSQLVATGLATASTNQPETLYFLTSILFNSNRTKQHI